MKCTRIGEKSCNCSCFEIYQEMDAILLIINNAHISYFCESAFSRCYIITDKESCKFAVNKRQNANYSFLPVTSKVSCIRKKRGQIICLQGNNSSMVIFVLKKRKVVR